MWKHLYAVFFLSHRMPFACVLSLELFCFYRRRRHISEACDTGLFSNLTAPIKRVSNKHLIRAFYQNTNTRQWAHEHSIHRSASHRTPKIGTHFLSRKNAVPISARSFTVNNDFVHKSKILSHVLSEFEQFRVENVIGSHSTYFGPLYRTNNLNKKKGGNGKPKSEIVYYICKYLWRP